MLLKLFFILFIINCGLCQYKDCGSKEGSLVNVSISDCEPNAKRCILKKKKSVTITINFTNVESKVVTAEVCGSLVFLNVVCAPFPLPESNGCNSGIKCPVTRNQINTYKASIDVKSVYPKAAVNVKWKLKDENGQDIICLIIPATIR